MTTVLPLHQNLTVYQGMTLRAAWRWKPDGEVIDLSDWTAQMQVRAKVDADTVMNALTTENGGITLGTDGLISVYLSATDTSAMPQSGGFYDLELYEPGGDVRRFVMGRVIVSREVTR